MAKTTKSIKTLAEAEAMNKKEAAMPATTKTPTTKKSAAPKKPAVKKAKNADLPPKPTAPVKEKAAKTPKTKAPKTPKAKAPAPKPAKAKGKKSITQVIYELLEKEGPENVTPEMATTAALAINPDSAFNKWHLYFHRRNYRAAILAGENPLEKWQK